MHEFIPSERFATWLKNLIAGFVKVFGVHQNDETFTIIYIISVIGIAFCAGWLIQRAILMVVRPILAKRLPEINQNLDESHLLKRCGQLLPPLTILSLIPFAFNSGHPHTRIIILASLFYAIISFVIAINSLFQFIWIRYNTRLNAKNLPLKGIVDIAKGAMWVIAVIVIISIIVDKSPLALLTGLGAFAAVILLIFKDSILGLVAGVQLSANDMLRVGDWISVPGTDANGIVQDVSLVTVKIRNWNNTYSMIPPYSLVSQHFVNWRYMKQGGSRQIEMSVPIDISTVRPLSDDELHTIQNEVPLLKDFIDIKLKQRAEGKASNVFNKEAGADGTIDTNLGLLRAYLNIYIPQHPYVMKDRICMVRILQPAGNGYPLQVFCYLTTSDWAAYEAITADIFEHITAIAPTFGLSIFEAPTDRSVFNLAQKTSPETPYFGTSPIQTPPPDPATNQLADN